MANVVRSPRRGKIDFARLNHVFIPSSSEERSRLRATRFVRALAPIASTWGALTDEGRMLSTLAPLAGAVSLDVRNTSAHLVFCALFGLLVGSLVCARFLVLRGVELHVDAPRRVTVGEPVRFVAHVQRREPGPLAALRFRGPFLPWDGLWLDRGPPEVAFETRTASSELRARFSARGVHHLDPFTVAMIAPLGLACGPRIESESIKISVVPRVANVVRMPIVLTTRHQPGGVALASKTGESMDLAGVRPYRPGDPVRDLHARSWARTGFPVVREWVQEHFTRVGVVLDTDIDDPARLEAAVELVAGVIAHLSRGEALVDVLVVGDRVHELVLGRSLGYLDQALDLLGTVERGPSMPVATMIARLEPFLERLSSVVLVSTKAEDATRTTFEEAIRARGIVTSTLVLDDAIADAIRKKEALSF